MTDCQTIFSTNLTIYKTGTDILKEAKAKFYTYTPKSLKPQNLVIKGIFGNWSTDDIKQEITSLNLDNTSIIKVSKIDLNKKAPNTPFYLVQLTDDSVTRNLMGVNNLCYQSVKIETLKKSGQFQCTKCQRVQHGNSGCELGYRCVKCKHDHKPGECQVPKDSPKEKIYCVNCSEYGHPASYRGCPYSVFMKQAKINARINQAKPRNDKIARIAQSLSNTNPNVGYNQNMDSLNPKMRTPR